MTLTTYIETIALPAIKEEKEKGYFSTAISVGWRYNAAVLAKELRERTGYKCEACGGTVYIVLV